MTPPKHRFACWSCDTLDALHTITTISEVLERLETGTYPNADDAIAEIKAILTTPTTDKDTL